MTAKDEELLALLDGLKPRARLLGVDLGTKTIGLALSDVERRIATPLETIQRVKFTRDAERIKVLAKKHDVGGLVVGLPLNMDGSEGPMAQAARAFAANLDAGLGLPVHLQDERLTTFAVRDAIEEGRLPRPRRPAEPLDHYAAAAILEDCLAALARGAVGRSAPS